MTVQAAMIDLEAIKSRQQAAWSSGDYAIVGTTLQIVGEDLCEAADIRADERVLDVAAGNGNATMAAARRFAEVTSTDFVPSLLERGAERAAAERLTIDFQTADVEALPFDDCAFDAVLSTFGVMFTPDHQKAADEIMRVCRPGGRIGLANWTPESFVGQMFKLIGRYVPPAPGLTPPPLWGTAKHLRNLFGPSVKIVTKTRDFAFRYRSPEHFVTVFRDYYGPMHKAFAAIDPEAQEGLKTSLLELLSEYNRAEDGTLVVPSAYLEAVATKA